MSRWRLSSRQRLLAAGIGGAFVLVAVLVLIAAVSAPGGGEASISAEVMGAVRHAGQDALTEENGGFLVDPNLRDQSPAVVRAQLLSPESLRARTTGFARSRSDSLAAGLRHSFAFYVNSEFTDQISSTFRDRDVWASSRFHVDHWYPVHAHGSTAQLRVRGEDRGTAWNGQTRTDNQATYSLTFTRDHTAPHGWRLTQQTAAGTAA